MIHNLKIKQKFAAEYFKGHKGWEIRKNDRDFKVGDTVCFTVEETDLKYERTITFLFDGGLFGLPEGYCIFSLEGYKYDPEFKSKDTFRRSPSEKEAYQEGYTRGLYKGRSEGFRAGQNDAYKEKALEFILSIPVEDQKDLAGVILHNIKREKKNQLINKANKNEK